MNEFEKANENELRRRANSAESRDVGVEGNKESEENEELKKMAAMEKVEKTSREVKTTKKQMQNLMANMQQVVKAVQAIRQQLDLVDPDGSIPSVAQDQQSLQLLQKKLAGLTGQMADLRIALFQEEYKEVQKMYRDWTEEQLKQETEKRVVKILEKLGLSAI